MSRQPVEKTLRKKRSVTLSDQTIKELKRFGKKNISEGIRQAARIVTTKCEWLDAAGSEGLYQTGCGVPTTDCWVDDERGEYCPSCRGKIVYKRK